MMKCLISLISLVPALAASELAALEEAVLVPFESRYELSIKGIPQGETRMRLEPDQPGTYLYHSLTQPKSVAAWFRDETVREQSRFELVAKTLRPLDFQYQRSSDRADRSVTIRFDWGKNRVLNSVEGDNWSMPVPVGTLDKILVNLALMLDLQHGLTHVEYPVADGGILKTYRFDVIDNTRIDTPAGTFDTVVVTRSREDKQSTRLWCAPELGYLPVRVERRLSDDMYYTSELKDYSASLRDWSVEDAAMGPERSGAESRIQNPEFSIQNSGVRREE
jgi:hypothetical protein